MIFHLAFNKLGTAGATLTCPAQTFNLNTSGFGKLQQGIACTIPAKLLPAITEGNGDIQSTFS
nr:hypothetical protein [Candidatus Thiodiazotropha sp. CDECU1]